MQSANYVPGVSGWKLHKNGSLEFKSSGDPCLSSVGKEEPPKPFIVVDGVTYIRQELSNESSTEKPKLTPQWTVKLELLNGQYVAAGIGLGIASQFLVSANQFAIKEPNSFETAREKGADAVMDFLAGKTLDTKLGEDLKAKISTMDLIKEAVMQGVTLGYQATLKDLGKTS